MDEKKYMIDRAVQIQTPYAKGSGTIFNFEKGKTDILTAQHVLSDIKRGNKYPLDKVFITLFKYYKDGIVKITPLRPKKIIDINENLDYAIIRFNPPFRVQKAELSEEPPETEDDVYMAGTSTMNIPYIRKGSVIDPDYLDLGLPLLAMNISIYHGDSGAGIYKISDQPKIVGIARYTMEGENQENIQFIGLSNSFPILKEYLEGLRK